MTMRVLKIAVCVGVQFIAAAAVAQQKSDTTATRKVTQKQDSVRTRAQAPAGPVDEIVLGEINIEAIIEKPNVDIIPKRKRPELEEMSLSERSFAREIREIPKDLHLYDKELDEPKKLDKLTKILTADKKKKK